MSRPWPQRSRHGVGVGLGLWMMAGRRLVALAAAAALLTIGPGGGAEPARARAPGDPATADLERGWRELEEQLRRLDRLLPQEPTPAPPASDAPAPLPAALLGPNAA
ncbi:MAG: hypothetical protein VKO44_01060, partial [Cyanobacteriota bacterium]|nr:hypothetical protein [Cyanobacteriota bacterium]